MRGNNATSSPVPSDARTMNERFPSSPGAHGQVVETSRQSDDIFVHRLLGLWFLGIGTGDIEVRFNTAGGGQRLYLLKNVWRAAHVEREINRLVA